MKATWIKVSAASLMLLVVLLVALSTRRTTLPATIDREDGPSRTKSKISDSLSGQVSNSPSRPNRPIVAADPSLDKMIASLDGMENGPQYQFTLKQIADLYAEINPDEGFEWLNSLPPTMESVGAFSSFFGKLGNLDPAKAIAFVEQIKFEGGQKAAASSASTIIAFNNPLLGWDLLNKWKLIMPDRLVMQGRLLQTISQGSGAEAAWNIYNPKGDNLSLEDTTRFFRAVRFKSPSEALDFISGKVTPDNQPSAMEAIVKSWLQTDLKSVSEELAARPIEPKYDRAYSALARQIFVTDPITAAQWSKIITDPKLKGTVQKEIKAYAKANDKTILNQVNAVLENQ